MKVSLPLSLKLSLWMLLNLSLLGAIAVGLFFAQGGRGWESLVRGATGDQAQALANLMAGEAAASPPGGRDAVLMRFGQTQHAEFFIFQNTGEPLAGPRLPLPAAVRAKLTEGQNPPPPPPQADPRPEPVDRPDPFAPPPRDPAPPRDDNSARGRFVVHTSAPTTYWVGFRVPFNDATNRRPIRTTVLARVTSARGLLALLNLTPWLLGGAAALALSVLFWLPVVRGITRALRQLTAATEKIAEGKFDTRVPTARRDELGALGASVNTMAARLETLVHGQRRFLADAAHELGSPLGRLQVATEILETRADAALQPQIADVREEVQHMAALVNELLAFTKAGLRPRDAVLAPVDLLPLVERVLAREDPSKRVTATVPAALTALADAELLERALRNLVRNALRYALTGPIIVTAHVADTHLFLTVADEGPGVPTDALARLGEPFYRPDEARTSEAGGTGLGLAITKSSIAACGGRVRFRNLQPSGFEVEIRLAVASTPPPS